MSQILKIEFAVNAKLPPGSNDLHLLEQLKGQLRHCFFPQAHGRIPKARRKYFNRRLEKYRADGLGTPLPDTQVIFEQTSFGDQLALYIKEEDQGKKVEQPWVRMEARLQACVPSKGDLERVGMLPHFAPQLRAYISSMFTVANGFKNADELVKRPGAPRDPWSAWGAQWEAKGAARLRKDAEANKHIGAALNELRSSLMRLKPPTAVAHRYKDWIEEMTYELLTKSR